MQQLLCIKPIYTLCYLPNKPSFFLGVDFELDAERSAAVDVSGAKADGPSVPNTAAEPGGGGGRGIVTRLILLFTLPKLGKA